MLYDRDLTKLQAALETTPVSVCVNAANWNDYTGGVMTSTACGPMGADYQDHVLDSLLAIHMLSSLLLLQCVMATGFNTTAPTPYWIVRK